MTRVYLLIPAALPVGGVLPAGGDSGPAFTPAPHGHDPAGRGGRWALRARF